jgi:osmotically inducible protein OsmC
MARTVAGHAQWYGSFTEGTGTLSTQTSDTITGAPYTFASRFDGAPGAIPEELLATGHAGCYNHALANIAGRNHITVESISTIAELAMGTDERGYSVDGVHLVVTARLDTTEEKFREIAEEARTGCSISKALRVPITLEATFTAAAQTSPTGQ